jgi:hypothetical protein
MLAEFNGNSLCDIAERLILVDLRLIVRGGAYWFYVIGLLCAW